jgi:peptidoglycan/xylan/chitin deacetylase (PgdA/CDA1 family)
LILTVNTLSSFSLARNLEEAPTEITHRAEGSIPIFTLASELRILPPPMDQTALTTGGLKKGEIALTFDDGPDPVWTPVVLNILRDHGVKATFFLVGRKAKAYPDLVKEILRDGHSIGNHTWDHSKLTLLSVDEARINIQKTKNILEKIGLEVGLLPQPFFRFPFGAGASNPIYKNLIGEFGYANFFWRMSAHDSRTKDPDVTLTWSIEMIEAYKRGIFLCHDVRPHTVKMLPYFLYELHRRGFKTIYHQAGPQVDNTILTGLFP